MLRSTEKGINLWGACEGESKISKSKVVQESKIKERKVGSWPENTKFEIGSGEKAIEML